MSTPESEQNVPTSGPDQRSVPPVPPAGPAAPDASPAATPEPPTAAESAGEPTLGRRMPAYVLVLGLVAGAAAWVLGEAMYGQFDPELTLEASLNNTQIGMQEAADTRTAAVLYGILAGLVGLCLGLGGGLARSNSRWAAIAGAVGLVVGGLGGALVALGVVPIHHARYNPDSQDLLLPMMIHGAMWAMAGLAGGLALGLGIGARRSLPGAILGGVVGALLGTALYEVAGAVAFPLANTVEPMSTSSGARLLACMAVALGASLGALAGLQPRRAKAEKPPVDVA